MSPRSSGKTSTWLAVNFKKHVTSMSCRLEPAIWSHDTGQQIPCFDRCQLLITWMFNIKEVHGKHARLHVCQPIIWSMAAILCNFTVAVVRTRPRTILVRSSLTFTANGKNRTFAVCLLLSSILAFCLRMREMNGIFEFGAICLNADALRRVFKWVIYVARKILSREMIDYNKFTHISNTVDMHFVCRDFG